MDGKVLEGRGCSSNRMFAPLSGNNESRCGTTVGSTCWRWHHHTFRWETEGNWAFYKEADHVGAADKNNILLCPTWCASLVYNYATWQRSSQNVTFLWFLWAKLWWQTLGQYWPVLLEIAPSTIFIYPDEEMFLKSIFMTTQSLIT